RAELSAAAAPRAGHLKTHIAAGLRHAARAAARRASFLFSGLEAASVADVTDIKPRKTELLHGAAHRFRERNVDLVLKIGAGLVFAYRLLRRSRAAEKLAEKIAKTSTAGALSAAPAEVESTEIEMNIFGRNPAVSATGRWNSARSRHVEAKLVIHLALFRIGKRLVGFLNLLELFFGRFVARVQIGVILARELAVSCANVLHACLARHSEQFVIIGFCRRCHRSKIFVTNSRYGVILKAAHYPPEGLAPNEHAIHNFAQRSFHCESSWASRAISSIFCRWPSERPAIAASF